MQSLVVYTTPHTRNRLRQLTRDVKKGDGSSLYNVTDVELVCLNCDAEALLALNNAILPDPKSQVAVDAFQQQVIDMDVRAAIKTL